ncbi:MAG: response regulator, partial [Candidatus Woesearchaeota archaeon]|nr:response regulator [Candidatus Woesearchaeota archaeon]
MSLDTILVVDDEASQRDALSDFFTSISDYEVLTASSGDEAVELLKKRKKAGEKTKAVIMDIKMPGKNGLEASLDIKNEVDRNIPVIFNTAFPDEFSESILRDKFLFFAYQTKGDDLDELSAKVERAVRHYNLMNETVDSYENDLKSFTVKNCALLSSKKGSSDIVRELLENHRGRPDAFLLSIVNNIPYTEKVRFIDGTLKLPDGLEEGNEENPSKIVCYGSLSRYKKEVFESLIPCGQAIFVVGLPNMSKDDKLAVKMRLNEQGFIVEKITESGDKKIVIEA